MNDALNGHVRLDLRALGLGCQHGYLGGVLRWSLTCPLLLVSQPNASISARPTLWVVALTVFTVRVRDVVVILGTFTVTGESLAGSVPTGICVPLLKVRVADVIWSWPSGRS